MKILFLTHRLPYAPDRGDRIRAFHLMREMATIGDVSLFSLVHDDAEEAEAARVPFARSVTTVRVPRIRRLAAGAAALLTSRPLTHALLDAPSVIPSLRRLVAADPPDVIVAYCSGMARFALEPPLVDLPLVLDMVDVDSQKWSEMAARSHTVRRWIYRREARTLRAFEAAAAAAARETTVVNIRERDVLRAIAPSAHVRVVENGIDLEAFSTSDPPVAEPVVNFCGVMNYGPNEEGVLWFARQIWPRVRAARPDARFVVVGAHPTAAVRALASQDASIEVTGRVPAVQPYLWRSAVSVAPLRLARGLQNKVLEALAAGLPVVVTDAVFDGLPAAARPGCLRANDEAAFASAVLERLQRSPSERRALARTANLSVLGWSESLREIGTVLRTAAASGSVGARPRG